MNRFMEGFWTERLGDLGFWTARLFGFGLYTSDPESW